MTIDPSAALEQRLLDAMRAAFGDALPADASPLLTPAKNPQFGDFQANAAMALGKALGVPPREVAQKIVAAAKLDDIAHPMEIAGPGFINIRMRAEALAAACQTMDTPALGIDPPTAQRTVVVDLCGVNLAKQMHVGHIRATVIGDAIARLHERLGNRVVRQNHFGDWGLPIAMVTDAVLRAERDGRIDLATLTLEGLELIYREAQAESAADRAGLAAAVRYGLGPKAIAECEEQVAGALESQQKSKAALLRLQAGDREYQRVWERISRITLDACFENCRRLHAKVDDSATAGESTYRDELGEVIRDLESRGVAELSQGALIVRLEDQGIKEPLLVRKSDGGFMYATTDLAAIRRRVQKLGADLVVYAVDARQSLHFRQVFAAARKAGYARTASGADAELVHAAFGTILGEDNRPFKTRSGDNVKLADLLEEAVERAGRAVAEKSPDLAPDDRNRIAEAVGIGAIKHTDLSSDRLRDYVFSFDRMLAFEGNTGPYLQYALVRILSIFRKAEERFGVSWDSLSGPLTIETPEEKAIALALLRYPTALRGAAESAEPHRLCAYLFDLATAFSSFFAACPVLQSEDVAVRTSRLRLSRLAGRVLRDGLETLGLTPLDRM
jgi:arginyl-tRNA synthetase